jgi:hypothetical protein
MYPGGSAPIHQKKSSAGIIIAILSVVIVGGGIAAFAVANSGGKDKDKKSDDAGVIGSNEPAPDAGGGVATVTDAPPVATDAPDVVAVVDAAVEPPKQVDAAVDIPATVDILLKGKYLTTFEVYEDGKKLFDGPDNLPVVVGESRKITIKAAGYREKTFTVSSDAKGRKFEFKLDKIPGVVIGPGSGSSKPPPPTDPGCKNVVVDPSSPACRKQYCQHHPDDLRCGAE